ncbi:MAG TPA: hypothetical protein VLC07_03080, partial [Solirubrobacterales bacterium]|nr:hypothetical protein [Solirubrobacterales bacterium]
MKVIETAKIIAARISLLFWLDESFMARPLPRGGRILPALRYSRPRNASRLLDRLWNRGRLL